MDNQSRKQGAARDLWCKRSVDNFGGMKANPHRRERAIYKINWRPEKILSFRDFIAKRLDRSISIFLTWFQGIQTMIKIHGYFIEELRKSG